MRKLLLAAAVIPLLALAGEKTFKYHDVQATVVSTDARAQTLTIRGEDGASHTARVEGAAVEKLGSLKAGDKVTLTCKDTESGQHVSVTGIKMAAPK